ncbi:uncharacterized protein [Diadema setosum]|uniref:uncharacterized protein n=1 Tax=Diadema setosum TaxID=31175 RepID=UPI003B3B4844
MDDSMKHFLLPLVIVLMMCFSNSQALEVYQFYEGRNVSLEFNQHLSIGSTFEYEIYSIDTSCYFCRNGTMIPGCLTRQQFRRFSVQSKRSSTYLRVTLSIDTINSEDSQFYLFALREDNNGKSTRTTQDVHVEVLRPPSPAACTVKLSEYSPAWNEVNCMSVLASDGEGSLYCFQDAEKAPYKESLVRHNDHVTWVFWMNVSLPINCCSYEASYPLTSASCSQFVYPTPTHTTVTTMSENSKNNPNSQTPTGCSNTAKDGLSLHSFPIRSQFTENLDSKSKADEGRLGWAQQLKDFDEKQLTLIKPL